MKQGFKLTLMTVAIALVHVSLTYGTAPVVTDPGDVIIGDLTATGPATGTNEFVFPDAFDLDEIVDDDTTADGDIKWSFTGGGGKITINGVGPLDPGLQGLNADDPTSPRTSSRIDQNNDDPGDAGLNNEDGDAGTVTFRNVDLSPVGGPNIEPGVDGIIDSQTVMITLFASDCSTYTAREITVFTANDTSDSLTGAGFELEMADDFTAGDPLGWAFAGGPAIGSSLDANGLNLLVPLVGGDDGQWVSPVPWFNLVANKVYRAHLEVSTDASAFDTVPTWFFNYSNGNLTTGFFDPLYGGDAWIHGAEGPENSIGFGRTLVGEPTDGTGTSAFDFVFAPTPGATAEWQSRAFTPAWDDKIDPFIAFRAIDNNAALGADTRGARISLSRVELSSIDRDALAFTNEFDPPISASQYGVVGGTIDGVANTWSLTLGTTGTANGVLAPADLTLPDLALQFHPVTWESNVIYRTQVDIQGDVATGDADPLDAIIVQMTVSAILGGSNNTGGGSFTARGDLGDLDLSPAGVSMTAAKVGVTKTYEAYMFSQTLTSATAVGADRLTGSLSVFNTTELYADGTGSDGIVVTGFRIQKAIDPGPFTPVVP